MPPKVERCVSGFMTDARNVKKWPDPDKRRQAAFAICNSAIKNEARHGYVLNLTSVTLEDVGDNLLSRGVHLLPFGEFEHPVYGDITIDPAKVTDYVSNFEHNVVGTMLMVDYEHRRNQAEGGRAAGWFTDMYMDPEKGLMGDIFWTKRGGQSVKEGEYRYMSVEYVDEYTPEKKGAKTYQNVLLGAAVTNHPFMRSLSPINFQDEGVDDEGPFDPPEGKYAQGDDDVNYRAAYVSTVRCLNCAFFVPGTSTGDADADGDGGSCLVVDGVIDPDWVCNFFEAMTNDDLSMMTDQEREEVKMEEFLKQLRVSLGLAEDAEPAKILEALTAKIAEKPPVEDKARQFAEDYPEEAAILAATREENLDLRVQRLLDGWSQAAFSVPPALFEGITKLRKQLTGEIAVVFDTFMNELTATGLVPKGEKGGGDPTKTLGDARDTFLASVKAYQDEHEGIAFVDAVSAVAKEHPDLAQAYYKTRATLSGVPTEQDETA